MSQRRACAVLGADRTMVRYVSRRPDDAKARERIRELASQRRRFGYRRLHWLLCREGWTMNHKKFRRLYREERLQVRRRGGHKRDDPGTYRPQEEVEIWMQTDPLPAFRERLVADARFGEARAAAIEAEVMATLDDSVEFALASPDPKVATAVEDVYA